MTTNGGREEIGAPQSRNFDEEGNSMNSGKATRAFVLASFLMALFFALPEVAQARPSHDSASGAGSSLEADAAGGSAPFTGAELAGAGMMQPADKVKPTAKGGKPKAKKGGKSKGKGKGKGKGKKKGSKKNKKKPGKNNKKSKPPEKRDKPGGGEEGPTDDNPLGMVYGERFIGDHFRDYLGDLNVKSSKIYIYWQQIEPAKDEYNFAIVDAFLDQMNEGDVPIIEVYSGSTWATEKLCKGSLPYDYDEYYEFIYDLVLHCDGKVKYWQRDSEPFSNSEKRWPSAQWREYIEVQREFYNAVKAADPDALVVGIGHGGHWVDGAPGSDPLWEVFLEYAKDWFDVVDLRLYEELYTVPDRVEWFANKMNDFGYTKPIFATEYGGPHPCGFPDGWDEIVGVMQDWSLAKTLAEENDPEAWWKFIHSVREDFVEPSARMFFLGAANELEEKHNLILARDIVQRTMLALGAGMERLWYWSLHAPWHNDLGPHPYFGKLRLTDLRNDYKEPAFAIYARMAAKLDGYESIERIDTGNEEVFFYRIERESKEPLFVLWEKRDVYDGETLPAVEFTWVFPWTSVVATDVFGNVATHYGSGGSVTLDITDTPLFLEAP